MRHQFESSFFRDVPEFSVAVVLEQRVATANRRDEQIFIAVVVGIGERGRHADSIWQRDAGLAGDVLEPAPAQIPPELVAADLVDEVDVVQAIAVDVRNRDAGTVIVMNGLVVLAGVFDDPVHERDAAGRLTVAELKLVKHLESAGGLPLRLLASRERVHADIGAGRPDVHRRRRARPAAADRRGGQQTAKTAPSTKNRCHRWELNGRSIQYGSCRIANATRAVVDDGSSTGRPRPIQLSPASSICIAMRSSGADGRLSVRTTSAATDAGSSSRTASVKYTRYSRPDRSSTTS